MPGAREPVLWAVVLLVSLTGPTFAVGSSPEQARLDYRHLTSWQFADEALAVPEGGLSWTVDTATIVLEKGTVRPMRPLSDGAVTGLLFEGRGRFRMTVPDPVERDQLRRFSERDDIETLDETISALVLRSSRDLSPLLRLPEEATYHSTESARRHHEKWLRIADRDVDARIVAGRAATEDEFLCADIKTGSFGWLTFEFDSRRREEIHLEKLRSGIDYPEVWVSLDREADRDEAGRPLGPWRPPVDITHVDLEVDLTRGPGAGSQGFSASKPVRATFRAKLTMRSLVDGWSALPLELSPWARVDSVRGGSGEEVPFLRYHLGARLASLDSELHHRGLLLLLDRPLTRGEELSLMVEYEMELLHYASGRSWYPGLREGINDLHTVRLAVTVPKKHDVRAAGVLEVTRKEGDRITSVWKTTRPTKMMGFVAGKRFREERIEIEGAPTVVSFGAEGVPVTGNMVHNVGVDVARSLAFFEQIFDFDLPFDTLYCTRIVGNHGQAFDGLLHLSESTFEGEHPGYSERFRAHEVAHQFWGHELGWSSYRDQWLSEAFAEYSALAFVEAALPRDKYFLRFLREYSESLTGPRPPGESRKTGPIGVGYRASAAAAPGAYYEQNYIKGALVLHMIRTILRLESGSDELFLAVLRDFLGDYRGKTARTADFRALLERRTGRDWGWFFAQWIDGTSIPTYVWDYRLARDPGAESSWILEIEVAQKEVPEGFRMKVPLRVVLDGDRSGEFLLDVKGPEESFRIPLPEKPRKVILNPDHAILARVRRR